MGILNQILGTGNLLEKGIDLIDKKFPSDAQMLEAQTKAKSDLLTAYAPFKIAQRYLALIISATFVFSFLLVLGMYFSGKPIGEVVEIIQAFKIDWIMLTIIGFYFGGGAFEGVINARKNNAKNK